MTPLMQILIAAAMVAAYALDAAWIKPRARHADFLASRDCVLFDRCWIR